MYFIQVKLNISEYKKLFYILIRDATRVEIGTACFAYNPSSN